MGISDLRDVSYIEEVDDDYVKGRDIVVDGNNWLYKYISTITKYTEKREYTSDDGVELPNLIGIPKGLSKFSKFNINPYVIFDGGYEDLKQDEVDRRKKKKKEAREKAKEHREKGDLVKSSLYESRSQSFTPEMIETSKELLEILDINYLQAPKSAESQAAYMVSQESPYSLVYSLDYDSILFGSPTTLRNFVSTKRDKEVLILSKTLDKHGISMNQLIDIAILCGTDYNEGVSGIGPKTSVKKIKQKGSIENLDDEVLEKLTEDYDIIRKIFLEPDVDSDFSKDAEKPNPNIEEAVEYIESKGIKIDDRVRDLEWSQSGLNSFL